MSLNHLLLKSFMDKQTYDQYYSYLNKSSLSTEERILLDDFKSYLKEFNKEQVQLDEFVPWFFQVKHKDFPESTCTNYNLIFDSINQVEVTNIPEIINEFNKQKLAEELIKLCLDPKFTPEEAQRFIETRYLKNQIEEVPLEAISGDNTISSVFSTVISGGYKWRLSCLNDSIGPLQGGTLGGIAAYVETGKTSFIASEMSHIASQLVDDERILWCNNEQADDMVRQRIWCATLNASAERIVQDQEKAESVFLKKMNGDRHRISVVNICGKPLSFIESLVKTYNIKVLVVDQIDNINSFGNSGTEALRMTLLYAYMREIAVKYNIAVLLVTQCDASCTWVNKETGEVEFKRYIGMHQLNQSKVGKQAAFDYLITIGKDARLPHSRFIHTPKNKLAIRDSQIANIKQEVRFDRFRSRYEDY